MSHFRPYPLPEDLRPDALQKEVAVAVTREPEPATVDIPGPPCSSCSYEIFGGGPGHHPAAARNVVEMLNPLRVVPPPTPEPSAHRGVLSEKDTQIAAHDRSVLDSASAVPRSLLPLNLEMLSGLTLDDEPADDRCEVAAEPEDYFGNADGSVEMVDQFEDCRPEVYLPFIGYEFKRFDSLKYWC